MLFLNTAQDDLTPFPEKGSKARRLAFILLLLAPLFFGCLALFLGQDANWDLRNYHWYNAYAFLNDRYGFDILPSQTPYFYNPALDVPFFLLGTHVSARTAGFILGAVQGLNFILLFMLCHATLIIPQARQKVVICASLSLLGMLGGGGIAQIGTTFYDNITSLGLFTSTLLVIRFLGVMTKGPWLKGLGLAILCGLPAGLMMGFKLPFVTFCVGLCGAILLVTGPVLKRFWVAFGFGLGVLIGLSLSFGSWGLFLYENFGNPLFPYFNDIFHSPLAPDSSGRDVQFLPNNWPDRLLFPFVFAQYPQRVGEIPWRDLRLPILYALLPVCVLTRLAFGRAKNAPDKLTTFIASRYLLWMAVISYIVWMFLFAIYRYAIPMEMITPLLIVVAISFLPIRPQPRALITFFVLLIIAATIQPGNWSRKDNWLDKTVQVTVPEIENPSQTMILMAGFEPYSHVVPSFPPEIPFVRVQSNFASPDEDKGINAVIKDRVMSHQGTFKLLVPETHFFHAEKALSHFGLIFSPQNCLAVEDHLFDSKLKLCDVNKRSTKPVKP